MKTRQGFVSNSSSSSFIVAFKNVPQSKEELRDMLFHTGQTEFHYYEDCFPIDGDISLLDIVWNDFQQQQSSPLTPEQIREEFGMGWIDGMPEHNWDKTPSFHDDPDAWRKYHDDYHQKCIQHANSVADTFMVTNPGCKFFKFHYSDNDGEVYSALEHGGTFDRLPHFCISHH